jgi:hypothetical protein
MRNRQHHTIPQHFSSEKRLLPLGTSATLGCAPAPAAPAAPAVDAGAAATAVELDDSWRVNLGVSALPLSSSASVGTAKTMLLRALPPAALDRFLLPPVALPVVL